MRWDMLGWVPYYYSRQWSRPMSRSCACWLAACGLLAAVGCFCGDGSFGRSQGTSAGQGSAGSDRYGDPLPAGALTRLGTTRFRHWKGDIAVFYALGGKALVSYGGYPAGARVWDPDSGKGLREFRTAEGMVPGVLFAAPGFPVAVGGSSGSKCLVAIGGSMDLANHKVVQEIAQWDVATGTKARTLGKVALGFGQGGEACLALGRDGRTVAAAGWGDHWLTLWDAETGRQLPAPREGSQRISALGFTFDGQTLALAEGGTVRFWDLARQREGEPLATGFPRLGSLCFSPDGRRLVVRVAQGILQSPLPDWPAFAAWDLTTGRRLPPFADQPRGAGALALSPDGKRLAWGSPRQRVRVWDVDTGAKLATLEGAAPVVSLDFAPDGRRLAAGDQLGAVHVWDVGSGKELSQPAGHRGEITAVAVSPDGSRAATGGRDQVTRVWSLPDGKEVLRAPAPPADVPQFPVAALGFSPDGRALVEVTHGYRQLRVADGETLRAFTWEAAVRSSHDSTLSADGKYLMTFARSVQPASPLEVRATDSGALVRRGDFPAGGLSGLALSADGKTVALGTRSPGQPAGFLLWDVATGKVARQWLAVDPITDLVALSPNGKLLASAGNGIQIWDVATGRPLGRLEGKAAINVMALTFSPDGEALAAGSLEGLVGLWRVKTGTALAEFAGHRGGVTCLGFDGRGLILVSGGEDSTALVWDVTRFASPASK
jgi:WD40 repeat protein